LEVGTVILVTSIQDLVSINRALHASHSSFSLSLELVGLLLSAFSSIALLAVQQIFCASHYTASSFIVISNWDE